QPLVLRRISGRADQRFDGQLVPGSGTAAGHGVRPDQRLVAFAPVRRVVGSAVRAGRGGGRGHRVVLRTGRADMGVAWGEVWRLPFTRAGSLAARLAGPG